MARTEIVAETRRDLGLLVVIQRLLSHSIIHSFPVALDRSDFYCSVHSTVKIIVGGEAENKSKGPR